MKDFSLQSKHGFLMEPVLSWGEVFKWQ